MSDWLGNIAQAIYYPETSGSVIGKEIQSVCTDRSIRRM